MRISLNWINDYVDIKDEDKKQMADKITNAGVNVEKIISYNFDNIVVGKIKSVKKHPASSHLNLCVVDVQDEDLKIVCGASNVKEDALVIVAKVGAILKDDFKISRRELRGEESNGMICALFELGLEEENEENYQKGIYIFPADANVKPGMPIKEALGLDDTIYELDLNPNRSDCLSHLGFAYEVAGVLGKKVTMPDVSYNKNLEKAKINLDVKTPLCTMYQACVVKNVKVGPSPKFIKERLENAGMRSINNVVDISNYIMLEYGQPLHFFDYDKLGENIIVREASDGEQITTLDGIERILTKDDIVICDKEKPVAIAGVMGGESTEVLESTKNILIESAIFNPLNVRYTSIRLGLRSESSIRFEKGLNYEYTSLALDRACHLLEKYASGNVTSSKTIYDKVDKTVKKATVSLDKINRVLGIEVPEKEVDHIFERLGYTYTKKDKVYDVTIPNRAMDIKITEDLIEEIGRIYGYDKLENKLPVLPIRKGGYEPKTKFRKELSRRLRALNLNEVKTYTLVSPKEALISQDECIKVLLPMSNDKSYIRTSLIASLLKVYDYHKKRDINDINIYEIANTYKISFEEDTKVAILMTGDYIKKNFMNVGIKNDFYVLKGIVENLLDYSGYSNRYSFEESSSLKEYYHPQIHANILVDHEEIGFIAKINPSYIMDDIYVAEFSLTKLFEKRSSKIKYEEISKYPAIKKDVAFILNKDVQAQNIIKDIKKVGTDILKEIEIFDLYEGEHIAENKKSVAFSLTFQAKERTLKDEEINKLFRAIIDHITKRYNCEIRDK